MAPPKERARLIRQGRKGRVANIRHDDINLTHPAWSRVLTRRLAAEAGGLAPDEKALFETTDDPRYQAILEAIQRGKKALCDRPRMDMPGAVPVAQERDFGKTF